MFGPVSSDVHSGLTCHATTGTRTRSTTCRWASASRRSPARCSALATSATWMRCAAGNDHAHCPSLQHSCRLLDHYKCSTHGRSVPRPIVSCMSAVSHIIVLRCWFLLRGEWQCTRMSLHVDRSYVLSRRSCACRRLPAQRWYCSTRAWTSHPAQVSAQPSSTCSPPPNTSRAASCRRHRRHNRVGSVSCSETQSRTRTD